MNLDELLTNVSVIGAAGKMGSGIVALVAQELANLKLNNPDKTYRLNCIDVNEQGLEGLQKYLKSQMVKVAEKGIVALRKSYESREDLVENWEVINEYVDDSLSVIRYTTDFACARDSKLVFEVVFENEELKIKILKQLKELCPEETLFFTNTSSIPVGFLAKEADLEGRIIGYHFYNPPIVQKLVEVITAEGTAQDFIDLSHEFGKRLRKKLFPSNDIAGFIGNGHFIRDGLYAMSEVERLKSEYSLPEAIYIMNEVSQNFLVRPMGIFQLIDYVGIDVFQCILSVMSKHLKDDSLHSELVDTFMKKGVKGGQRPNGSQKDGFLKYEKGAPAGVYDLETDSYVELAGIKEKLDAKIGNPPEGFNPWKKLLKDADKDAKLAAYFGNVKTAEGLGAELARNYMKRSKEIGQNLLDDRVARSADDVNAVLMNGFFWLYGPINEYI
ncbi:3-hydroxyacyl-CoA dehydrogenase family protein [Fibrobacterota bacterium]